MDQEKQVYELVEDCLQSGKSQKEFSQEASIGYAKNSTIGYANKEPDFRVLLLGLYK